MSDDLSRIRRYELKYLIFEETASGIRDTIRHFFVPDRHTDPVTHKYIVNNLYFDTDNLQFYHDTRFRKLMRFKPRVRYYNEHPDYIYPELKYRNSSVIWKTRSRVPASEWANLINPPPSNRIEPDMKDKLDSFQDVMDMFQARPVLQVRYEREAYVTELENYGRITFDRKLSSRPARGSFDLELDDDYVFYDDAQTMRGYGSMVILEIKVETNVPAWVIDIVSRFNLVQTGFSKYCNGIECHMGYATGPHRGLSRSVV